MSEGNQVRPERIREMFDSISGVYDPMNTVISGFQEPRWRLRAIRAAALQPGMRALDVATGTGKVAYGLWRAVQPGGSATGIDFAEGMLRVARKRYAGVAGELQRVLDGPYATPGGIAARSGIVRFDDGRSAVVPLANLSALDRPDA